MINRETMMPWIIDCLKSRGGSGWPKEVAKHVWENHELEIKTSGDILYTWQYDLRWAAQKLRDEGTLKAVDGRNDLPWELSECQKRS